MNALVSEKELSPAAAGAPAAGEELLRVDVSLSFGGVKAITNISFDILKGEIRAIIGPNGAGKTSMLNVINGFYHPQEGTITWQGKVRRKMKPYEAASKGIARTFQNVALFKGMTTLDNIMSGRSLKMQKNFFWQMLWRGPAENGRDRAPQKGRGHHRFPRDPGDPQNTGWPACLMACKSGWSLAVRLPWSRIFCCLDEPMAGMNLEEKEDMSRFIIDVNQEFGTTIALIEHDMGVVMDLSDRVVVLDYGKKIADGPPEEVQASQAVIDAYLGVSH
jgi:branched-chain amino acid transport system ATP-binding protein